MAKIVDPDSLNQGTEVIIDTSAKTIQLLIAGNLDDNSPGRTSGATGQSVYSFLKEEWKDDPSLNRFRFPLLAITKTDFIWINGWQPADAQTRQLIRDSGWREVDGTEYAGIISLGDFNAPLSDRAYYQQTAGFAESTTNFDKTGELNEAIQVFDGGSQDFRGFLKIFLREQGKTYAISNLLVDQDLSALEPTVYRVPLANATDIKVTETDNTIDTTSPFTSMAVSYLSGSGFTTHGFGVGYVVGDVVFNTGSGDGRWYFCTANHTSVDGPTEGTDSGNWEAFAGERQIGSEWYAFNRIISGSEGTAEEIYQWSQRQLRLTSSINSNLVGTPNQDDFGLVYGNTANYLLSFLGDTLQTAPGVYVDFFNVNDQNRIEFFDITVDGGGLDSEYVPSTTTARTFPFVAAGNIIFNDALVNDVTADTLYKMYFTYTRRFTNTDVSMDSVLLNSGALTSSLIDFTNLSSGDYVRLSGFSNTENNGIFRVDGVPTTNELPVTKPYNQSTTLVTEAAGNTVNVDSDPFDTPDAIVVLDNNSSPITGTITAASIPFTFDYDNNVQGSRTPASDAPVNIVAQGLNDAQWVEGSFTITRATGLSFPINAADERNYSNS